MQRPISHLECRILSADLFQSSSVLAYSCNPQCLPIQHPQSLPILTHLEASKHPSIPDCRNPSFDHLKGVTAGPSRTPQGILGWQTLCPPTPPLALKLVLPPARECQMAHLTSNRHPSIQASEHPGIQASIIQVPEVGGRGGSL